MKKESTIRKGKKITVKDSHGRTGHPGNSLLSLMRTRVWINDLLDRTGSPSNAALGKRLNEGQDEEDRLNIRIGRYLSGIVAPKEPVRETIHKRMASIAPKSRFAYEIGPEEGGEFIPLWMMFEDRDTEFWPAIKDMLSAESQDVPSTNASATDQIGALLLPKEEWAKLFDNQMPAFQADNPIQQSFDQNYFQPRLRLLAIVLGMWRVCMFNREYTVPMEYLLHCLLAGPYKEKLTQMGIYWQVNTLVKGLGVRHQLRLGNPAAAMNVFSALEILKPVKESEKPTNGEATVS